MIVDLHCDTLDKVINNVGANLINNNFHVSFENMKRGNYLTQFFACFVDRAEYPNHFQRCNQLIDIFYENVNNQAILKQATTFTSILEYQKLDLLSGFLSIEDGEALEGDIDNLQHFYNRGVRSIGLLWNYENTIGYPNVMKEFRNKGLKKFGFELIEAMNDLGIIIDVSHLSDAGFYDVVKTTKAPFIASHSNARAVTNHPRNLTDDMIKIIASNGGVIGVNYVLSFLGSESVAKISDIVKHIKHIINIGGSEVCALGSDFDGTKTPEMNNCGEIDKLIDEMVKEKISLETIDKITHLNALRVIKDICS